MTLPTYKPVRVPTHALPYSRETESILIAEYGQEAILDLDAEWEQDYIVEIDGVPQKMSGADFHAEYHKPTGTADTVKTLIEGGMSVTNVSRLLHISRPTVYRGLNA